MSSHPAWRGTRCLRVALEFGVRRVKVGGLLLLDTPAVQRPFLEGSLLVQVVVDGITAVLHSFDDPRLIRGASRPEIPGHSYLRVDRATTFVKVPLPEHWADVAIRIRIIDLSKRPHRPVEAVALQKWLEREGAELRVVADIGPDQIHAHPDWLTLGLTGGSLAEHEGHYAIYVDRTGKYRWRLLNGAGQIVANSGQGFALRSACEQELRWIRAHGATVPIRSLDLE